jgi:hypothetical protein
MEFTFDFGRNSSGFLSFHKMAASEDELLLPRLPELFETSKKLLEDVEVATEPTGSRTIQDKVSKGLELLEKAAGMLSQLDLFRYGGEGRNRREGMASKGRAIALGWKGPLRLKPRGSYLFTRVHSFHSPLFF